jgi:hypothetical protein
MMKNTQLTSSTANITLLTRLCLITASFVLTATSAAATNENTAYVDSVHHWGPWELDIEPAAGGLKAQTTQVLKARDSKVRLRTNSISALAPPQRPETITRPPAPLPATPAAPVMPPAPTLTPISPSIPIPVGGPGDGF